MTIRIDEAYTKIIIDFMIEHLDDLSPEQMRVLEYLQDKMLQILGI